MTLIAALGAPAFAQSDVKATVLKHLKTSRDFTLKVAEQMPESDYNFKLTPPQMSFAEQLVHLSQGGEYFLSPIFGEKPNPAKPASMKKADVIAFVKMSFDASIEKVSKLTPEQISKSYKSDEGTMTGLEMLMGLLDHTTHHRASAEMYLRAKGITPAEYQF
ncbi:MAG: DinB family protein [Acidobacteriia bacterium]|nr:DinB family protein [Terriglobia bacterium]